MLPPLWLKISLWKNKDFLQTNEKEFNSGIIVKSNLKIRVLGNYSHNEEIKNDLRIFFHETSGNNFLNVRQVCAVESAAMNNTDRPVQLFMHASLSLNYSSSWLTVLAHYPNIAMVFINDTQYFQKTPLEKWYIKKVSGGRAL